ncbi:hypothetical protein [Pantoea stewartii]|uniref:hypothetical protein n=1 Tax=Pantoea stewartii TaxID=66269 RepID=UPI001390368C|nr:hypothetical protein [Pantoea stewartii]
MFNVFSARLIYCVLILNLTMINTYASDNIDAKAWRQTPETSYPTICEKKQIEIFSCPGKLKKTLAICMDSENKKMTFAHQEYMNKISLQLNKIQQIIDAPSGGSSTILQAETKKGLFRFYLDENSSDSDYTNAFTINGSVVFECIHNRGAYRTPTYIIKLNQGESEMVNLWHLKSEPFYKEEQKNNTQSYDDKIYDLWESWPK